MAASARLRQTALITMLIAGSLPDSAAAQLRSPQVPVLTGRLQAYLNGVGEHINVATDQRDDSLLAVVHCSGKNTTQTLQLELARADDASPDSVGIYNTASTGLDRVTLFPAEAVSGWFTVVSFRHNPDRIIVNMFDAVANLVITRATPGGDQAHSGIWIQGPGGTFFSEAARNPLGAVQVLSFAGTGINSGSEWLCIEDQPIGAGSDQDYDDLVIFSEPPSECPTPVQRSSWAAVKERFR